MCERAKSLSACRVRKRLSWKYSGISDRFKNNIRKLDRKDAKKVPVIALTANVFEEDVPKCLSAELNEHLSKPMDIEALVQMLGRLITEEM